MADIYAELRQKAPSHLATQGLLDEKVRIKARTLPPEEAIGNPEADDFPYLPDSSSEFAIRIRKIPAAANTALSLKLRRRPNR